MAEVDFSSARIRLIAPNGLINALNYLANSSNISAINENEQGVGTLTGRQTTDEEQNGILIKTTYYNISFTNGGTKLYVTASGDLNGPAYEISNISYQTGDIATFAIKLQVPGTKRIS